MPPSLPHRSWTAHRAPAWHRPPQRVTELLKGKRDPLIAHGSEAELLLGINHICHRQIHHRNRRVADEVLGRQQCPNFSPNQTPLLHRGWLGQLHLFQEIHGLLLDLLPFNNAVLSSLRSTTTLSSAVSFHSNGEVLPGVPQLLQRELMAIDPQQSRQGPCLDFLLPTDPDTAIGRRRFIPAVSFGRVIKAYVAMKAQKVHDEIMKQPHVAGRSRPGWAVIPCGRTPNLILLQHTNAQNALRIGPPNGIPPRRGCASVERWCCQSRRRSTW